MNEALKKSLKEPVARTLEHIAVGLRDDTFELCNIEMSQSAFPAPREDGNVEYSPSGEFTLVLSYKRKDH